MQEQIIFNKTWHNGSLPFKENIIFSKELISPVKKYDNWPESFKKENPSLLKNEINENGFRSDSFKNFHNGEHILFAGCSYTWGVGLSIDEIWPKIVYDKISKIKQCSGFFNLGIPGSSIINQIFYILKYCKQYGNPNIIFINIPDLKRFYYYENKEKIFYEGGYDDFVSEKIIEALSFQYYYMFEQYCFTNNIKIYSFSWCNAENKSGFFGFNKKQELEKFKTFKTFYSYSDKDLIDFIIEYKEKNKNDIFLELARDREHLGKAYHAFWSNFIFDKFNDSLV